MEKITESMGELQSHDEVRVLVVEDDEFMCKSLRNYFLTEGYEVTAVGTGEAGVQEAKKNHFDLVVADLKLPGMDGLEMLRAVKEIVPGIVSLIITAYGSMESEAEATRLGVSGFITKPFSIDQLAEAVGVAVEKRRGWSVMPQVHRTKDLLTTGNCGQISDKDKK